jgi:hypothetical protein
MVYAGGKVVTRVGELVKVGVAVKVGLAATK